MRETWSRGTLVLSPNKGTSTTGSSIVAASGLASRNRPSDCAIASSAYMKEMATSYLKVFGSSMQESGDA